MISNKTWCPFAERRVHQVNALLDDQRRTEVTDSFHSVACRWLKGNTPIWQSWMPKAGVNLLGGVFSGVIKLPILGGPNNANVR